MVNVSDFEWTCAHRVLGKEEIAVEKMTGLVVKRFDESGDRITEDILKSQNTIQVKSNTKTRGSK